MLRAFRRTDGPAFFPMLSRYFPEEAALLQFRPEAYDRLMDRVFRWDARFVLGLLDLVRRPVVKLFVIEADGRLVGTSILTFPHRAGYLSTVMVDEGYRGRGFAKRMVHACEEASRRSGKRFAVLDVLSENAPAIALYRTLGYLPLRTQTYRSMELPDPPRAAMPPADAVRPFRRGDGKALARIAAAQMPARVAEVLAPRPGDYQLTPIVTLGLDSETEAWVIDRGHGAEGFVRATSGAATVSGHLTAPLLDPGVPAPLADSLVDPGLTWLSKRGIHRVVCEISDDNRSGREALGRAGFTEAFGVETFYRPLDS